MLSQDVYDYAFECIWIWKNEGAKWITSILELYIMFDIENIMNSIGFMMMYYVEIILN